MRAREFLETIQQKGNHVVFNEPWDPDFDVSIYMHPYMDPKTGKFKYPELEQLRLPSGQFDIAKVPSIVDQLMQKYPQPGSPFWGWSQKSEPKYYDKERQDVIARLQNALKQQNDSKSPRSRFYWPNRPQPENGVPGYRGTPKGVENVAKKFDPQDIQFYLSSIKWAVTRRFLEPIPAEQWAMLLLVEGRDDFGFNIGQWLEQSGPQWRKFEQQLEQAGLGNKTQRCFVALVKSKQDVVKRTGMSFYQAWNGGTQYVDRYQAQQVAVKDPRNKPLLDLVRSALA